MGVANAVGHRASRAPQRERLLHATGRLTETEPSNLSPADGADFVYSKSAYISPSRRPAMTFVRYSSLRPVVVRWNSGERMPFAWAR